MSEIKKQTIRQLTTNGKLITFGVGALLGVLVFAFATNAAAIAFSSLAIGDISKPDQFAVGSWFRYDFGTYNPQPGQSFYIVTKIESITTAGDPVLGDPLVASKLGNDASWYNWSIKAYWMTGVEAKSLYGKNSTGNPLWDDFARFLFEGYAMRHTYTIEGVVDQSFTNRAVISRPQFIDMKIINNPYESWYGNTTAYTTGWWAHRAVTAGIHMITYQKVSGSAYFTNGYDIDSGLLLFGCAGTGYFGVEWALTQYSAGVRYIPVINASQVAPPIFNFVNGVDSSIGYIEFSKAQTYRAWKVTIVSNDTTIVQNMPQTKFVERMIPINVTNVGVVIINVTVIGDYFGVDSLSVTKLFIITRSGPSSDKVNTTIVTSVVATSDSIIVKWNLVVNASEYLVFANNTFVGKTGFTEFSFHPKVNGLFDIFVIVTSTIHAESSDPSNIKTVNYTHSGLFVGEYATPPPVTDPTNYIVFMIIVIVIVTGLVVSYMLWKQSTIQKVGKLVKSTASVSTKRRRI